jgi:uncharacterized protein YndB with AHSA1/START domain
MSNTRVDTLERPVDAAVLEAAWLEQREPPRLEHVDRDLPPLYTPGARTIARDRWERIISAHVIPASPEAVWEALTNPEDIGRWLVTCRGSLENPGRDCILDFEDGDFFLCRPIVVDRPRYLEWRWRWLGIGPAWTVKWSLRAVEGGTRVVVADESLNPPARTGHYRGEGWPEILDMLAAYLRTRTEYRWPSRSQSFELIDLPATVYAAWDRLFSPEGLKWWLHAFSGTVAAGQTLTLEMGDATGALDLTIQYVQPPAYNMYPFVAFTMKRPFWPAALPGRIFMEPAGWGGTVLQSFQTGWETLGPGLQQRERPTIVGFFAEAFRRAARYCEADGLPRDATPWVLSALERNRVVPADSVPAIGDVAGDI